MILGIAVQSRPMVLPGDGRLQAPQDSMSHWVLIHSKRWLVGDDDLATAYAEKPLGHPEGAVSFRVTGDAGRWTHLKSSISSLSSWRRTGFPETFCFVLGTKALPQRNWSLGQSEIWSQRVISATLMSNDSHHMYSLEDTSLEPRF